MAKKLMTREGVTLVEVTKEVEKRQKKQLKREKAAEEMFNRPPMIGTAITSSVATLAASYFAVSAAGSYVFGAILCMVGFLGTMIAKGSRDSKLCIILAVLNVLVAITLTVIWLKTQGVFDWIETSIVQ